MKKLESNQPDPNQEHHDQQNQQTIDVPAADDATPIPCWWSRDVFDRVVYAWYAGPHRYFLNGWGPDCQQLTRQLVLNHLRRPSSLHPPTTPTVAAAAPLRIHWYGRQVVASVGAPRVVIWRGAFPSPALDLFHSSAPLPSPLSPLPAAVHTAHLLLVLPWPREDHFFHPRRHPTPPLPLLLSLASSGDQDFRWRTRRLALPLAASHGLGTLLLMNAFYAKRRPPGQHEHFVGSLSHLMTMGICTILEAHALLTTCHALGHPLLTVTGFSMGGTMACTVAALFDRQPLGVVACVPADCAADVYCDGVIATSIAWDRLGPDPAAARAQLRALLEETRVSVLPPAAQPHQVTLIGGLSDAFIPLASVKRLAAYWGPQRCQLVWFSGGHVTAFLLAPPLYRQAILTTFQRLSHHPFHSNVSSSSNQSHHFLSSAL